MGPMKLETRAAPIILIAILLATGVLLAPPRAIPQAAPPRHVDVPEEQRVDINHATLEDLLKVPGMTKAGPDALCVSGPIERNRI